MSFTHITHMRTRRCLQGQLKINPCLCSKLLLMPTLSVTCREQHFEVCGRYYARLAASSLLLVGIVLDDIDQLFAKCNCMGWDPRLFVNCCGSENTMIIILWFCDHAAPSGLQGCCHRRHRYKNWGPQAHVWPAVELDLASVANRKELTCHYCTVQRPWILKNTRILCLNSG